MKTWAVYRITTCTKTWKTVDERVVKTLQARTGHTASAECAKRNRLGHGNADVCVAYKYAELPA